MGCGTLYAQEIIQKKPQTGLKQMDSVKVTKKDLEER
jgi:hypothetical protein